MRSLVGKNIIVIILFYILVLIAAIFIPNISDYNAYLLLSFCLIYYVTIDIRHLFKDILLFTIPLFIVSLNQPIVYNLIDCATVFFIIVSIDISKRHYSNFTLNWWLILFIYLIFFLSILGMFDNRSYRLYTDGYLRYIGIFNNTNFSANIFSVLCILIWEIEKKVKDRKNILIIIFIEFIFYIWVTRTRSLLFFIPYWFYQFNNKFSKKIIVLTIISLLLIESKNIVNLISNRMALSDEFDGSISTRSYLYSKMIDGIIRNYFIIPYGAHTATDLSVNITNTKSFTPHNDFLRYVYEWGLVFYILCIYIYKKLKPYFNLEFVLIMLAMSSFALHNMLFSPYVIIPFIMIIIIRNTNYKNEKKKITSNC